MSADLIDRMREIAAPVLTFYVDDLEKHDRRLIEGAGPGTVMLWGPRSHGTHMIVLARDGAPNRSAREHFKATQVTLPAIRWYRIDFAAHGWTVAEERDPAATVDRYHAATRTAPQTVSEIHL
jgi:hypothetical protein